MQDIFGVNNNGTHIDVSKTEKGAKQYATRNGYTRVSVRYNSGYNAVIIARKQGKKWRKENSL